MPKRYTVEKTIRELVEFRPVLSPVLTMFAPLLEARASLAEKLQAAVEESGFRRPAWDVEKGRAGAPLFADADITPLEGAMRASADALLPVLEALKPFGPWKSSLEDFLTDTRCFMAAARGLLAGSESALAGAANEKHLPAAVLLFALESVLGPVIKAAAGTDAPWDAHPAAWRSGICPVCGSGPIIGHLDPKPVDATNPALHGGGGGQHLHCGMCGTEWHFRRGACPACGADDEGVLENIQEEGLNRGERAVWCTKCKSYYPVIDLRERLGWPDMATMALGMIHLDIIAAGRGLQPLRPSFWNQFQA